MLEFFEVIKHNDFDHITEHDSYHMTLESAENRVNYLIRQNRGKVNFFVPEIRGHTFKDAPAITEFNLPVLIGFDMETVIGKGRLMDSGNGSAIFIVTDKPFDTELLEGGMAIGFIWSPANPIINKI